MTTTTEIWIDSDYLTELWDSLDKDKFVVRHVFDNNVRESISYLYDQIRILKTEEYEKRKSNPKEV